MLVAIHLMNIAVNLTRSFPHECPSSKLAPLVCLVFLGRWSETILLFSQMVSCKVLTFELQPPQKKPYGLHLTAYKSLWYFSLGLGSVDLFLIIHK